ncbi:MAG: peptide deformylase [Bacteroidales bacterium]|nr:peptide deformylase [Candidatus Hennigimonas equi]
MKKSISLLPALAILTLSGCSENWNADEKRIINSESDTLHVYTVSDPEEEALLRSTSAEISPAMIRSLEYSTLASKMVATVSSPAQDGVGIAGPQVGILRRIVAVQRFDKDGEPFEVYPNISITKVYGDPAPGPEGCLSVPGRRGDVYRWQDIEISYSSPKTLRDTTERITGFTAVIFQHECDHLNGTLYTDKLAY